ncbi:MAG: FAD-binding oxidoreductase [Aureispira sp.]
MTKSHLSPNQLHQLQNLLGHAYVHTQLKTRQQYGQDQTEDLQFLPAVVVQPANTQEISALMQWCYQEEIPVTPRGAGTGLAGGALPVFGGVVLSLERLNQVLHLDEESLQVMVEPHVITQELQELVQTKGLYYPPDPASSGSCSIGGNVATNAGGPRAVKYGVVKDYVLNLEVVLPTGEIIWTGANTLKNSTGYNMTALLVGSEGTLGIITKIVLKLVPYPQHQLLLLASFPTVEAACKGVVAIFKAGITPSALEFMEHKALQLSAAYLGQEAPSTAVQAQLLIEVDGSQLESLYLDCEQIDAVLQPLGCTELLFAEDAATKNKLWALRRNLNPAVKKQATAVKKADTVVPRAALPALLQGIHSIADRYGISAVNYGHAGDGNVHVTLMREQQSAEEWAENMPPAIAAVFELVAQLGGTISGEHGIGWIQRQYLPLVFSSVELGLMQQIKRVFDPKGLLNPAKLWEDA